MPQRYLSLSWNSFFLQWFSLRNPLLTSRSFQKKYNHSVSGVPKSATCHFLPELAINPLFWLVIKTNSWRSPFGLDVHNTRWTTNLCQESIYGQVGNWETVFRGQSSQVRSNRWRCGLTLHDLNHVLCVSNYILYMSFDCFQSYILSQCFPIFCFTIGRHFVGEVCALQSSGSRHVQKTLGWRQTPRERQAWQVMNQKNPCSRPVQQNVCSGVWNSGFKIELDEFDVKIRQG